MNRQPRKLKKNNQFQALISFYFVSLEFLKTNCFKWAKKFQILSISFIEMTFNLNFQKKSVPICHKRKWCKTKVSKFRTYTLWSSISRVMIFLPKANLKIINYTHLSAKLNMIPTKIHKSILTSMKIWNENVYSPYRRAEPGFQKQKEIKVY